MIIKTKCKICRRQFKQFHYQKNKYCSRKCFYKSMKETRKGKNNPNYIGGKYCRSLKQCIDCGKKISYAAKRCQSCASRKHQMGKSNSMWKPIGTYFLNTNGYKIIKIKNNKWMSEHIYKVEKYLKRKLKKGETVHHINEKRNDNRLSNLYLFIKKGFHCCFSTLVKNGIIKKDILKSNLKQLKKI